MTDLREKIIDLLDEWGAQPSEAIADCIIALLPKVPKLRWNQFGEAFVGRIYFGRTYRTHRMINGDTWEALFEYPQKHFSCSTEQEAQAAIEKALREALGWEA